jgi:hypothetical protein
MEACGGLKGQAPAVGGFLWDVNIKYGVAPTNYGNLFFQNHKR